MKNLNLTLSSLSVRLATYLCVAAFGILSLSSCKKKEDPTVDKSYIRIINTSPTAATFNAYLNDKMANTVPLPFGGTIAYLLVDPGTYSIKLTTASDIQSLLTKSVSVTKNLAYSYYVIDKAPNLDGLLVTDDMSMATIDKTFVKFINLSPDAPALDLKIKDGAAITTGKTYKTSSTFTGIEAKTYTFEIKDTNTGVVKATLSDVALTAGRFYTIVARGLMTPGNNEKAFGVQSVINQ